MPIPAASVRGFSECWPDSLQARWVATSARAVRRPRTHLSSPYARQKAARAAQQRGAGSALGDGVLVSELWVAGFAHRRRWQRGRRRAGRRRGRGLVFIVERCIHDSDASERRVSQGWHLRRANVDLGQGRTGALGLTQRDFARPRLRGVSTYSGSRKRNRVGALSVSPLATARKRCPQ